MGRFRTAMTPASHPPRGDFALNARMLRIAAMAVVIGAFSTIAARVLLDLIRFFTNLSSSRPCRWLIVRRPRTRWAPG